jgi:hypothetical protein
MRLAIWPMACLLAWEDCLCSSYWISLESVEKRRLFDVEYARSQPKTALLIAMGVGLTVGMLLTLGRK